jgi:hypothetical protein
MITAPPRARPRAPAVAWTDAVPVALAAAGAVAWLIVAVPSVDLAAHVYRARAPFALWDGNWYAGHHTLGYSVLFPPLGWLVGVRLAGALAAVAAAALFARLRRGPAAVWFAVGTTATLFNGRLTFLLGVAFGLAALLAYSRGRPWLAAPFAIATALASPVAALFLVLAAVALSLAGRRDALILAAAAALPLLLLVAAFPEGGYEPFATSAFLPLPLLALAAAALLPREERALRIGSLLYALAGVAAYAIHTPVGSNAVRLGALFGGPLLVAALPLRRRPLAAAALLAAFGWWMVSPAVRDVAKVSADPAARAAYYRPLLAFLDRAGGPPARVEIPFTRAHWEAAYVAPRFPLARGWERQLDVARNPLFYRDRLTAAAYASWLSARAVRFVALPDATLDYSARSEAALIGRGLPYLTLRWRTAHWRVYEFTGAHALVVATAPARIDALELTSSSVVLSVTHPGTAIVRVAWSPYWRLAGGCVERAGDWTRITTARKGTLRLAISFDLLRVVDRSRRCG